MRSSIYHVAQCLALLLLACTCWSLAHAQTGSPLIQGIVDRVNLDSLTLHVKILSGEVGWRNGGGTDTILERRYNSRGHALAIQYLQERLRDYGYTVQLQAFTAQGGQSVVNVLASHPGVTHPGMKYVLSAHYDATAPVGTLAPGADDDASGVATVLEAARILSCYPSSYNVVFAFWDLGQLGLFGSQYYARQAAFAGDTILGDVNLDMLGYDSDGDGHAEIHTRDSAQSVSLSNAASEVNSTYNVGLQCVVYNPGADASDHRSFWHWGFSAILLIEDSSNGDFNRSLHTDLDRIERFNLPYFHRMAKLAVGTMATLAEIGGATSVNDISRLATSFGLHQNYPNPFNPSTTIAYQLPTAGYVRLVVFDVLGREVRELERGYCHAGYYSTRWDASAVPSGVYYGRFTVTDDLGQVKYMKVIKLVITR